MQHPLLRRYQSVLCLLVLCLLAPVLRAQYTPGNLVVLRTGDGATALSSAAAPVNLVELTPAGTIVNTLAIPTTAAGSNYALAQSGSASSEGALNLSADGRYLVLVGYDAAAGTATVASNATYNRVVGRVAQDRTINTTTILQNASAYGSNNFRSAVSNDGTQFWTAGTGANAGVRYVTLGNNSGGGTQLSSAPTNTRVVNIVNGQLYVTAATTSYQSVAIVGTGLPTTSGQTTTILPGLPTAAGSPASNPYAYVLLDRDPTVAGVDLLYVADQTNGVLKYSFDGTTWTARGSVTGVATGLTGFYNCATSTVELYVTSGSAAGNTIYKLSDAAASTASVTGSITAAGTLLATAPANTVFRGVAFAPGTSTVAPIAYSVTGGGTYCGSAGVAIGLSNSTTGVSYQLYNGAMAIGSAVAGTGSALSFPVQTTAGTYTVIGTNTLTGCTTTQSGNAVIVNGVPTTASAGPAQTIVAGGSATLAANTPTTGTGTWSVRSGPSAQASQFSSVTDPSAMFTPAGGAGSYVLTWTIANAPCTPSGSDVTITVNAAPQPNLTATVAGPASTVLGATYAYSLVIGNTGAAAATAVSAQFTLPAGVNYVGTSGGTFTASQSGGVVTLTDGNLSSGTSQSIFVEVTATGGPGTITLPAGGLVVDPADAIAESSETDNSSPSAVSTSITAPAVTLSVNTNSTAETTPASVITVTATASAPVVGDQTVALAVAGTGITSGDYSLSSPTITILNGQTTSSVTLTVADDNAVEGTETAVLTINNPSANIVLGNPATQSISITDNDVAPGLSINDVTLAEGNSGTTNFVFTISLATPAPAGGVTFDVATSDNTAQAGSDYTALSLTGQTIPEGSQSAQVTVAVNGDVAFEADELFTVTVSNVVGAIVSKSTGTGTIQNDDAQPRPDLTLALTAAPNPVVAGNALTYSFTATNTGSADAAQVGVSLPIPAGTTFQSVQAPATWSTNTPAAENGFIILATRATLAVNAPAEFTVVVQPTTANPALTATVSVSTATTEQNPNNNTASTTVAVNAANRAPVAPTLPNQTGTVAVPFTYTVPAFTDPDNQALTYAITGLTAGLVADNGTRVISGTPTATGVSTVKVVATDPQNAGTTGEFTITINANAAPVAPTVADQTATVGVAYSQTIPPFTDTENQTLTYAAINLPAPFSFDPATRIITGTPTTTGNVPVRIEATDPAGNVTPLLFTIQVSPAPAVGNIQITEYMYNGSGGEFIELTNVGNAPVDMTGWSFDDASRTPGSFAIGAFGVVQPGESVIISEQPAATFRTNWYLPASVKVIGGNNQNLGNGDEINVYDASNSLIDRLTYGNSGNVITNGTSAWPATANLSATTAASWQLSVVGDAQQSYAATAGNIANPGGYYAALNRVLVRESGGTTTVTEGGATDTYTVALNSQPSADVTITIDPGSQLTVNPTTLTFTPANYATAQTVMVTAVDDAVFQGAPRPVTITQSASSAEGVYNGIVVNPVSVTITDNDVAATAPPTIVAANTTTPYLTLPANGPGYVSGVANDATDPARTQGINFTLSDPDTDVNTLQVTATSSNANATVSLTGTGGSRNLTITPVGVGYATITVTVSDGSNTAGYVINYAASAASVAGTTRFHTGTSDASTAVVIDPSYMLVADDENQVLRLYNRQNSGLPVAGFDFTSSLGLTDVSGGVPREVDLELSVRQGNRIFWLGSQSNADGGNARPNRDRVFATDVAGSGAATTLSYVGRYDFLRADILNWDATNGHGKGANYYGLQASAAAGIGSKQVSGYNIEGAEFAPDGTTVYLGFRAPQVLPANRTKALIIPATNLTSLISGQAQGSATFGAPIELDLGGRGIRELRKNAGNEYVILAGAAGDAGAAPNDFRLFTWTGNPADAPVERQTDLTALNASGSFESIVEVPASLATGASLQLLVDNGDAVYYNDGTIAKELMQPTFKKFRSDLVTLGAALNTAPTVANPVPPQTATVGTIYTLSLANVFTDNETPNQLTLSVSGLPAGLNFTAPATIAGTPTTEIGSPFSVTVTATDPGSLTAQNIFDITVSPAPVNPPTPTGSFSITGVTPVSCQTVTAGERLVTFNPGYAGTDGSAITFSVVNELAATTNAGPYTLRLYTDNATIILRATQGGTTANFAYNWLAGCGTTTPTNPPTNPPMPPTPTSPFSITGVTPVSCQTVTAGERLVTFNPGYAGTDGSTITFQVVNELAATTAAGPYTLRLYVDNATIQLRATQGGTTANFAYNWLATCGSSTPINPPMPPAPGGPFSITGVTPVSCQATTAGERLVTFNPGYAGTDGSTITFQVVNELAATTAAGPYTLRLYTDNATIQLQATQGGTTSTFAYNWLAVCNTNGRVGVAESTEPLMIQVLGNPIQNGQLSVDVRGAQGQALEIRLTDSRGQVFDTFRSGQAEAVQHHTFDVSRQAAGMLLLRASTPTKSQLIKVIKTN